MSVPPPRMSVGPEVDGVAPKNVGGGPEVDGVGPRMLVGPEVGGPTRKRCHPPRMSVGVVGPQNVGGP